MQLRPRSTQRVCSYHGNFSTKSKSPQPIINDIQITGDGLTGRAGLSLFVRYFREIGLSSSLERLFGSMRRSGKGSPVTVLFKQLFCFFLDGTSLHLIHFDTLKQDDGYAASIKTDGYLPGELPLAIFPAMR